MGGGTALPAWRFYEYGNNDESSSLGNDESVSKNTLRFQNFEEKADVKTCFLCHDITQSLLIK